MSEKTLENLKQFARPITLAEVVYTHFKLRESSVQDMFEAELALLNVGGGTHTPLAFNGEMMVRQLVTVRNGEGKSFDGPFTINMLKNWGTPNYRALRAAQQEIDLLGEV